MNARFGSSRIARPQADYSLWYTVPKPSIGSIVLLLGLWLSPATSWADGIVSSPTEPALRSAMAGGGSVTFAFDGTITLANTITNSTNTVLDGSGHQVTISGGNSVRVFYVPTNTSLTLSALTIANGWSEKGAGVFNDGGQLTLQYATFSNNSASGSFGSPGTPGTNGEGGAVYNLGSAKANHCAFRSNSACGSSGSVAVSFGPGFPGGDGNGGALENLGTLVLTDCVLTGNSAVGGTGGGGGPSSSGGSGGQGNGSAVANFGSLTMSNCSLANNTCSGASGAPGGAGQYSPPWGRGGPGGLGGSGGSANGAIFNGGSAYLVNSTVTSNSAAGAQGGWGGSGGPPFNQSSWSGDGGGGGAGGSGTATVLDLNGRCYLTNCTLAMNQSIPGPGGQGGPAGFWPYPYPPRVGSAGGNGASGSASGLCTAGSVLVNTLLGSNSPVNCSGTILDAGHNLSSDASPGFSGAGSRMGIDPQLGPLTNNGGPTLTMALLPGSPAIDAGDTAAAPATDQRGFPRPAGLAADIGAFEYGSTLPLLSIARSSPSLLDIAVHGNSNQWCRLLVSSNLSSWIPLATNQIGASGTLLLHDNWDPAAQRRWYRVASP